MPERIYAVYLVELRKKTDESRRKDYEISRIRYPEHFTSFEQYERYLKTWHEYDYDIGFWLNALFKTEEEAKAAVEQNAAGIYEAGKYRYAVLASLMLGTMYVEESVERNSVQVFQYVTPNKYIKISGQIASEICRRFLGKLEGE